MAVLLGFDPGGADRFGWCICNATEDLPLTIRETGCASSAHEAVEQIRARNREEVLGLGIDAPLFWTFDGSRKVDQVIRNAIRKAGAPAPGGTVQDINSLRGACLVQGILAAILLRRHYPNLIISESHPKAFLWLSRARQGSSLRQYLVDCSDRTEDERDAAIACLSAWAAARVPDSWRDLAVLDADQYSPVAPVTYWMPRWEPESTSCH